MAGVRLRSRLPQLIGIVVLAASAGACARVHARTIGPPLETPAAPPRTVPTAARPIESQPIVASPPVGDIDTPTPPAITPPEAPPAVATRPPALQEPPPALQTTTNPVAAEQRTRSALASATRDLGRIDVRTLSSDARAQYDIARRFVAQANDALNRKNYEFAQQLADKAATLAALLQR